MTLRAFFSSKSFSLTSSNFFLASSPESVAGDIQAEIADDYFKAKRIGDDLQNEIDEKDKEVYELKHELITDQIQLDTRLKELKDLKAELLRLQKENVRLETELESMMKNN